MAMNCTQRLCVSTSPLRATTSDAFFVMSRGTRKDLVIFQGPQERDTRWIDVCRSAWGIAILSRITALIWEGYVPFECPDRRSIERHEDGRKFGVGVSTKRCEDIGGNLKLKVHVSL